MARTKRPLADRFWPKVNKGPRPKGCWLWTAATLPKGYGLIGRGGRGNGNILAHRASWELANKRRVPDGLDVLHTCDTPACINPDHLFLGTNQDNVDDMIAKGRRVSCNSKLRRVRESLLRLGWTQAQIKSESYRLIRRPAKYSVRDIRVVQALKRRGWSSNRIGRDVGIPPSTAHVLGHRAL